MGWSGLRFVFCLRLGLRHLNRSFVFPAYGFGLFGGLCLLLQDAVPALLAQGIRVHIQKRPADAMAATAASLITVIDQATGAEPERTALHRRIGAVRPVANAKLLGHFLVTVSLQQGFLLFDRFPDALHVFPDGAVGEGYLRDTHGECTGLPPGKDQRGVLSEFRILGSVKILIAAQDLFPERAPERVKHLDPHLETGDLLGVQIVKFQLYQQILGIGVPQQRAGTDQNRGVFGVEAGGKHKQTCVTFSHGSPSQFGQVTAVKAAGSGTAPVGESRDQQVTDQREKESKEEVFALGPAFHNSDFIKLACHEIVQDKSQHEQNDFDVNRHFPHSFYQDNSSIPRELCKRNAKKVRK